MLYDITPTISERLAVWPGDNPPKRNVLLDMTKGDNITLSTLQTTVHVGAHADAPNHYGATAESIDQRDLSYYLGPCQVIAVKIQRGHSIQPGMITDEIHAERILFATSTFPNPEQFNQDFASLTPELVTWLSQQNVKLIGIDTPSVDPFDSKELPSHQAFLKHNMAILEGIRLEKVPPGDYELIALPLKLEGFDASPVRAVLRTM